MQFKLTKKEKSWIFYDVGNSAFVLMVSTILPVYFNYLAQNAGVSDVDYLAYWGYAASISTLIVAVLGPVMGTLADTRGFKKPLFLSCILVGCAGCLLMGLTTWWISFLVIFIIAKVGFNSSLVFYDSMLSDVTAPERMDRVSSSGYAWGYAGSCIPFIVSLVFVLGYQKMGFSFETGMMIAFAVVAVWWLVMSLPLMKQYRQVHYVERKPHAMRESVGRIIETLRSVRKQKKIFLFLIAFFFFIDGVYTIIDMATAYGSALGLGFHRTASCIACDTVCCISVFHSVWQACGKIRYRKADFNLYCCVYGDYRFCRVYEGTVAVLGAGNFCGNVPGGHSGTVPVLFCKNCSAGAFRRVFWSDGYLWKRSILYGNDGGRTGFPGFWEYKHRDIRNRISLPCGSTVFYENRAQWIGKYEKSGERYHGTADVP